MRISLKKVFFILIGALSFLRIQAQDAELVGRWLEFSQKQVISDTSFIIHKSDHPETIIFKANHRYKIIFYAFALEDTFYLHSHRKIAKGSYRVNDGKITFIRKGMEVSEEYSIKNDTFQLTRSLGEYLGIPTAVTSYRRFK